MGAGIVLGVALSGFFDGILLHQVLQWHHLLSLAPGSFQRDPRLQIAADGLFHLAMYLIMVVGLVLLWRSRAGQRPGDTRDLGRSLLLGFGAWNVFDIIAVHWVAGLHRTRVDVAQPLAWDLGWLVLFGLIPTLAATVLRDSGGRPPWRARPRRLSASVLTVMILAAGAWAAKPPAAGVALVLFHPGISDARILQAIAAADARLIGTDPSGEVAFVSLPRAGAAWEFYRRGALLVGSAGPAGCAAWSVPARPPSQRST